MNVLEQFLLNVVLWIKIWIPMIINMLLCSHIFLLII